MDAAEMVEDFQLFDEWEDRYTYLIDLGRKLPPLADEERCPETKVEGCLSQVWFARRDRGDGRLWFDADSDSAIVRGLIGVLRVLYLGSTPAEVAAVDIEGLFGAIGLQEHLTVNRRNGFFSMVGRIQRFSAEM
ncbi:MAG: cysteine desulfuration protein SufE [Myxococcota bacterium]